MEPSNMNNKPPTKQKAPRNVTSQKAQIWIKDENKEIII